MEDGECSPHQASRRGLLVTKWPDPAIRRPWCSLALVSGRANSSLRRVWVQGAPWGIPPKIPTQGNCIHATRGWRQAWVPWPKYEVLSDLCFGCDPRNRGGSQYGRGVKEESTVLMGHRA